MIKKTLIIGILVSSPLFIHPCFSMWCCGKGEKDAEKSSLVPSHRRHKIDNQAFIKAAVNQLSEQPEHNTGKQRVQPGERNNKENHQEIEAAPPIVHQPVIEPDDQIIRQGQLSFKLPKHLGVISCDEESTYLVFKNIFDIKIFADYNVALEKDPHIKGVSQVPLDLRTQNSVTRRMEIFYKDIRAKVTAEDQQMAEEMIRCLQKIVVDEVLSITPLPKSFPIKFASDEQTTSCALLFKIKEGVLFIKGPGKKL